MMAYRGQRSASLTAGLNNLVPDFKALAPIEGTDHLKGRRRLHLTAGTNAPLIDYNPMDWITTSPRSVMLILLSSVAVYVALVLFTRWLGLRSFSKMSGFDFAVTVAFGSILASVILAEDPPVVNGVVALGSLFLIQAVISILRRDSERFEALMSNKPRLIMMRGEVVTEQLRAAKMTESDLMSKLREANVFKRAEAIAVFAETTGDVCVLHDSDPDAMVDSCLLDGVVCSDAQRRELTGE